MKWEEWVEKYQPIKNELDPHAAYDGYLFETYGPQLEAVMKTRAENPYLIWTMRDEGDLTQGLGVVNRLGYFICRVPIQEGEPDLITDAELWG